MLRKSPQMQPGIMKRRIRWTLGSPSLSRTPGTASQTTWMPLSAWMEMVRGNTEQGSLMQGCNCLPQDFGEHACGHSQPGLTLPGPSSPAATMAYCGHGWAKLGHRKETCCHRKKSLAELSGPRMQSAASCLWVNRLWKQGHPLWTIGIKQKNRVQPLCTLGWFTYHLGPLTLNGRGPVSHWLMGGLLMWPTL